MEVLPPLSPAPKKNIYTFRYARPTIVIHKNGSRLPVTYGKSDDCVIVLVKKINFEKSPVESIFFSVLYFFVTSFNKTTASHPTQDTRRRR